MTCDNYRELLSAELDGELTAAELVDLEQHVAGCAGCSGYRAELAAAQPRRELAQQAMRLHAADELASIPEPKATLAGSLRAVSALRWALFIIGGTLVVLNVSNLIFDVDSVDRHLSRHDGVFGTALGIGMLSVAAKPQRAIGLVSLTSTIAVLMGIVAIADVIGGQRTMLAEAIHLLEFGGLICLWVISGGVTRARRLVARSGPYSSAQHSAVARSSVPQWPTTP